VDDDDTQQSVEAELITDEAASGVADEGIAAETVTAGNLTNST